MRKNLLMSLFIFTLIFSFNVTAKNEGDPNKDSFKPKVITYYFYYTTWDGWGRTSMSCDGFGLCHFMDCWNCCIDEATGNVVDCPTETNLSKAGLLKFEQGSIDGIMEIRLQPTDDESLNAIENQLPLYVDQDLVGTYFTIKAGVYQFNPNMGSHGGYTLNASQLYAR